MRCRLKILVCMKQVPQKDAPLKLNESATWVREDVGYEVNEPDAYALEEALRQKEKYGGEVVVLTAGPGTVKAVFHINLPRPRVVQEILFDPRFVATYERIWEALSDEVKEADARTTAVVATDAILDLV